MHGMNVISMLFSYLVVLDIYDSLSLFEEVA